MNNTSGKKIALGVCGGIAAYKVVELARSLTQAGADVRVVMTQSAMNFVGPITFSTLTNNPIRTELFPGTAPSEIPHTDLGRTSDIVVIAPATAKVIAKFAQGISDDLMSALLLSAQCPIVMAPAMHTEMWENDATRGNVATLRSRGVTFVGPDSGALAGPDVGVGRLAEIAEILQVIDEELSRSSSLSGVRLVVSAGGTRESIDAVRFLGNRSSGRMGYEIAFEAIKRGAKVTLVSGPSSLDPPMGAETIQVTTAAEMHEAVFRAVDGADAVIMAAAVSDWRPIAPSTEKLKKKDGPPSVKLEATPDILAELGATRKELGLKVIVGFCAETKELLEYARQKLIEKNADIIVANTVGVPDSGFDVATNRAVIVESKQALELPLMSKRLLAKALLDAVARRL